MIWFNKFSLVEQIYEKDAPLKPDNLTDVCPVNS